MRQLLFASFIVLAACTSPNPRSCADGLCTDQRFPYCDADGTFEGVPNACIAVECEPSTFVRCLGDRAASCNATGNDYDFDSCHHGCNDETGCRQCATNDQCPVATPLCDAGGVCRACVMDDDCASRVCEAGACIAESGILYASGGGADNGACTKAAPCTSARAIGLASIASVLPVVRLLPGPYATGLIFDRQTAAPLHVVATGATIVAPTGIAVTSGADVWIRGPEVTATTDAVSCDSSAGSSRLKLTDSGLNAAGAFSALVRLGHCQLRLEASTLMINASNDGAVYLDSNAGMSGDRLRILGSPAHPANIGAVFSSRVSLSLTNSLMVNAPIIFRTGDTSGPGSRAAFANNTFVATSHDCPSTGTGSAFRTIFYDNNIVVGPALFDTVTGTGCQWQNNVVFPQGSGLVGNVIADPQFVDPALGNYHLKQSSPAVDHATATPGFPSFSADLDGVIRPQGVAPDIGAYERKPE